MNVGIFWVYDGSVIGRTSPLCDAEQSIPGLLDSPQNHSEAWSDIRASFPRALRDGEYFEIPRGRVLYSEITKQSIVYMDATLHKQNIKKKIAAFFKLDYKAISWRVDDHYSTNSEFLDDLFGDIEA